MRSDDRGGAFVAMPAGMSLPAPEALKAKHIDRLPPFGGPAVLGFLLCRALRLDLQLSAPLAAWLAGPAGELHQSRLATRSATFGAALVEILGSIAGAAVGALREPGRWPLSGESSQR